MRDFLRLLALAAGAVGFPAAPAVAAPPLVVASIAPLHSLAAGVTEGVSVPYLLVRGGASPHSYSLTPSDARALSEAGLIVWVGESLEGFLDKPLATLGTRARTLELDALGTLDILSARDAGVWKDGGDRERHHGHGGHEGHGGRDGHEDRSRAIDPHLWLSTRNAEAILAGMSAALSVIDPANAALYDGNATRMASRIAAARGEIAAMLAPVAGRPFIVFHDAWQYFEREFGLTAAGAISLSPERTPGARRLVEIRNRIVEAQVRCVFAEPQFSPALVETVIRETGARSATLDPLGADLAPGPNLYPVLIRNLARNLLSCLQDRKG
ncbi:MAG: zinc ABC transporter substrate-binding protein [Rhodospirillaceae bacterium]